MDGRAFLVSTEGGDIPFGLPHGFGLFHRDCRFLDGLELTVNGKAPTVLSGRGMRVSETRHHLTNPELPGAGGRRSIARNTIAIHRRRLIRAGVVHERLSIRNCGRDPARLRVELRFRARFDDIFVVKGFLPRAADAIRPPQVSRNRVELARAGRDEVLRTTRIRFVPPPARLSAEHARFDMSLAPGQEQELAMTVVADEREADAPASRAGDPRAPAETLERWSRRAEAIWLDRSARVRASNPLFERVLQRALLDLHLLRSRLDGHDYFAAGIPWFVTLFGRDAAIAGLQTLGYGSAMARQTLRLLARYQATEVDDYRDAAPGKILHELRRGELARLGAIPQSPAYYGSVDATMLFLILTAEYVNWSGDLGLARELRPNLDAALGWMAREADAAGGYLQYTGRYENGLVNQGWKDSGNALVNADGSLAEPPIALCEVQAYAYRAWRQTARLLRALGDPETAASLDRRADGLRSRFAQDFWDERLQCYVLARQAAGRPAAVVASNAGQVLWGEVAPAEQAARLVERLLAPDMFSGWGIRTLSAESAAYNPMSYHLGSVWPHDNSLILAGFRRYGHDAAALRLFDGLFDAASNLRDYRLPELFCGYRREESADRPIPYPVACSPQAWAAGALPYALWSLLGFRPDALHRRLHIRRPLLPEWLEWVEIENLRVGAARVDVRFERGAAADRGSAVKWAIREGELDVAHTDGAPPPGTFE